MVWFQTEAFFNFDKLYGKIEGKLSKDQNYTFTITQKDLYSGFDVEKHIVISTTSFMGDDIVLPIFFGLATGYVIVLLIVFSILEKRYV